MPVAQEVKPQYEHISILKKVQDTSYVKVKDSFSYKPSVIEINVKNVIEEIPFHLFDIKKKISEARKILDYGYNWDDNGALPINPLIFNRASRFLETYADRIYDVCNKVLITPEIAPVSDGSIDLEWTLVNSSFLINFKNTYEEIAFYYGEFKDNDNVMFDTNGQINTSAVKDKFASYLADLS